MSTLARTSKFNSNLIQVVQKHLSHLVNRNSGI